MGDPDPSISPLVAKLAEKWAEEIRLGREVSAEQVRREYPQLADLAEPLLATVKLMCGQDAETGSSVFADGGTDAGDHSEFLPIDLANIGPVPDPLPPVPKQIGGYEINRQIGRGGMGLVFDARHVELDKRVALKILLHTASLNPISQQRFRNESRAASQLDHPNVVEVFDSGVEQGWYYFAMRMVDGYDLAQLISAVRKDGPPVEDADPQTDRQVTHCQEFASVHLGQYRSTDWWNRSVQIAIQIARALQHAHSRGVVHRDIKPSNLILDHDGKPWVTDFGLTLSDNNVTLTRTGDLLGTIRYMSPEQVAAGSQPTDHRTDIYSLGVTLYELVTLEPALQGSSHAHLLDQLRQPMIRSPRRRLREVPRDLDAVISKACA